jgi:hypothetical protein
MGRGPVEGIAVGTRGRSIAAVVLLAGLAAVAFAAPPDREAAKKREYQARRTGLLRTTGAAHIKLGLWCRDAGLVPQATAEFLRAVDVSQGALPLAQKLVDIMRAYGDDFWTSVQKKPKALLRTYDKKARELEKDHLQARLKLARDTAKDGLVEEAYAEYCGVVRASEKPLAFDAKGQVVVDGATLPLDISERMKREAVVIDGKSYLRDEFLLLLPDVKEVFEADSDDLRVRSTASAEQAKDLHAVVSASFPFLEDDADGRPTRKMQLFVFADRKTYGTWCDAAKRPGFKAASGLADGPTFTAIVCAEGIPLESVRGMAIHELAHLFQYGVTPAVMPSWYSEGFAETWGGDGTFTWDGTKLTAGGLMNKGRIDAVRAPPGYIPLSEMLSGDALKFLTADKSKGLRFYTQSWAFRRYLKSAAPGDVPARFRQWETLCRGAALGGDYAKAREEDTTPAEQAFQKAFGKDLPAIEKGFQAWLAGL